MTPMNLAQLKEIAEKATPGPWYPCGCRFSIVSSNMNPQEILDICDTKVADAMSIEQAEFNNLHIAAFNPTTALALIEKIERLEKALSGLVKSEVVRTTEHITYSEAYLNALEALRSET